MLGVYLVAVVENDSLDWSCEAQAAFKLYQKDGRTENCVVKDLQKKTFDKRNQFHGIDEFLEWDNFMQNHVNENEAEFEIEISAGLLRRKNMAFRHMNRVSTMIRVVIEGASKLTNSCIYPSEHVVQGILWKVSCKKQNEFFSVFIRLDEDDVESNDWSYKADVSFELKSFQRDVKSISMNFNHEFTPQSSR